MGQHLQECDVFQNLVQLRTCIYIIYTVVKLWLTLASLCSGQRSPDLPRCADWSTSIANAHLIRSTLIGVDLHSFSVFWPD